jgi:hypothetical protein
MGEWYVNDDCMPGGAQDSNAASANNGNHTITQRCCAAKPIIKCHFCDKPSIIPCNDSPPEKENSKSTFHPKTSIKRRLLSLKSMG